MEHKPLQSLRTMAPENRLWGSSLTAEGIPMRPEACEAALSPMLVGSRRGAPASPPPPRPGPAPAPHPADTEQAHTDLCSLRPPEALFDLNIWLIPHFTASPLSNHPHTPFRWRENTCLWPTASFSREPSLHLPRPMTRPSLLL